MTKVYIPNLKDDIAAYLAWQIAYKKRTGSLPKVGHDEHGDYVDVADEASDANVGKKSCGDCSLCCKLMNVPELNKPRNVWCQHVAVGKGCNIHETRPEVCRGFFCRWTEDVGLGPEWKPNKCKFVLAHHGEDSLTVYVDPGAPGAWRKEPYLSRLTAMARQGLENNGILKIVENGQTLVILPHGVVPLGVVRPDDRIMLEKQPTPNGFAYNVFVERKE